MQERKRPRVLVLGASGRTGGAVAAALANSDAALEVVHASRSADAVRGWRSEGHAAVHIDLDDARTFAAALDGVDRLFLMAGYTVSMTHQAKTVVDAAADAGVGFVVHLGVFGNGRSTDPHFAWHELVERYIEGSGMAWTHLHPHTFMETLLTTFRLRGDRVVWPIGDKPMGWVANEDVAAVAAKVLADGPDVHAGRGHWLSTDLLDAEGVAVALTEALGRTITAEVRTPAEFARAAAASGAGGVPSFMDDSYAASVAEFLQQVFDGRMVHAERTTPTVQELLGRPPIHFREWAARHRAGLLAPVGV